MSTLTILPCFMDIVPSEGWLSVPVQVGGYATAPSYPQGLRFNPNDIFADSPPIGDELYLITGFTLGYSSTIQYVGQTAGDVIEVQTQFSLEVASDNVASQIQTGNVTITSTNQWATVAGIFSADLVNPVAVSPGDRAAIKLAINNGDAGLPSEGMVSLGFQTTYDTTTNLYVPTAAASAIRYSIINRAMT